MGTASNKPNIGTAIVSLALGLGSLWLAALVSVWLVERSLDLDLLVF